MLKIFTKTWDSCLVYRHRGTSRGSKEHVEHEIEAILYPRVFSVAPFRNLVPRPRVFSQAREKTLGTRLTISGNFGVVFARVVPGQSSSPSLPLIISLHLSELIYLWPVVGYAFTFLYINFLPIFPSFSANLKDPPLLVSEYHYLKESMDLIENKSLHLPV